MRAVGVHITVGNTQSANNINRITGIQIVRHKANQQIQWEYMKPHARPRTAQGVMFRPAHVAHVLATEPTLGVIIPPCIIPHVGTNIPPVSGHVIHAMRDTILVV